LPKFARVLNPKVSILLPVKNAENWLDECIESIVAQTYTNWECIVVDDHCTDNSMQKISIFSFFDARFRIIKNDGKGLIDANKTALRIAKGEFITRMDADDIMPENRLQKMLDLYNKFNSTDKLIITGKVEFFPPENCGEGTVFYQNWLNALCEKQNHWQCIWRECVIPSPCWLLRREHLVQIGGFNSATYPEDYDLAFRLWENGFTVKSVDEICHYWRQHKQRFSHTENYSAKNFMLLKWKYFSKLELHKFSQIILLGTGDKAKIIKQLLIENNMPFHWVSHDENVIGNTIHGIKINSVFTVSRKDKTCIISALSSIDDFESVYDYINTIAIPVYRFC
jgi:glycosyltransferase involved in cell wall biosynthesis